MQNPYEPPKASVATDPQAPQLKKLSVWLMIGLTIVTLGLYLPYWMYTRTKMFNEVIGDEDVNQIFTTFAVGFFLLTYGFDVSESFLDIPSNAAGIFKVLGLASNICVLVWALMFRSALNGYTRAKPRDELWSNGFFTWIFQSFYHQYKINQIVDAQSAERSELLPAIG